MGVVVVVVVICANSGPRDGRGRHDVFYLSICLCVPAELFLDWLAVEFLQMYFSRIIIQYCIVFGGSVAEWLACWTLAQYGLGSNRSRDAVG